MHDVQQCINCPWIYKATKKVTYSIFKIYFFMDISHGQDANLGCLKSKASKGFHIVQ